ncbi:LysR family transcriptional regulator [Cellulosimicrobium cellulans]|uniref:LysR family transcriptional regulator n=1 Tax=Cellulosimicrobium cellulans TaxID=1710 RepID=UPI0023EAF95A|nr:LysR family transcriptional regulator [Cellulosimicrobium cellulans]
MRAFVMAARTGSMTSAAKALNYSVSAVSVQIARLEKQLGVPLLERRGKSVVLTDAGHAVHSEACAAIEAHTRILAAVKVPVSSEAANGPQASHGVA